LIVLGFFRRIRSIEKGTNPVKIQPGVPISQGDPRGAASGAREAVIPRSRPENPDYVCNTDSCYQTTDPAGIDLRRISAVLKQMTEGEYAVPAEQVADAIMEEAAWIAKWLD
jgi:anti-sigma28 factor (negative regulator of flagellin synthesis)